MLYAGMKKFCKFGLLALLLASYLAPAMACMVSDMQMSAEERACCRTMSNQCGQMEMSATHACCQKTPPSARDNALDTKAEAFHSVVAPVIWLAAFEFVDPTPAVSGWVARPDFSPPKSPPSTISILRI